MKKTHQNKLRNLCMLDIRCPLCSTKIRKIPTKGFKNKTLTKWTLVTHYRYMCDGQGCPNLE